jgi:hypothetical protein
MNCLKESVEVLFSIADTMNTDDLDADFKKIMEIGVKALKQSGNIIMFLFNTI